MDEKYQQSGVKTEAVFKDSLTNSIENHCGEGSISIINMRTRRWISESIQEDLAKLVVKPMSGGASAAIYQVGNFVLKSYVDTEWLAEEPDLVKHEARSLRYAKKGGLRVPTVIAYDEHGEKSGKPLILMDKLEGSPVLAPNDSVHFVEGLAQTLAAIHKQDATDFEWVYSSYTDMSTAIIPKWATNSTTWQRAIELANGPTPNQSVCFIHRDYHPTNILWQDGQVSGIVDWVNACRGPAGIDVGHCRVNLALLHGVEMADAFLVAYCREAVEFNYDTYFDIISVLDFIDGPLTVYKGWTDLGVTGLTDQLMEERMDAFMESVVGRIK